MVMFLAVKLKDLFEKGRDYPWPKPERCPCCHSQRLWGHGFGEAFFDGYKHPLVIKLYRCPDCGCVIRIRPKGYFKRFQAPVETIRASISLKSSKNRWLRGISRTRQAHWFRALQRRIAAYLTGVWGGSMDLGFDRLLQLGHNPVSRFI